MQFLKSIALLAAILPVAFSCEPTIQRCNNNNLEECNGEGRYEVIKTCSSTELCTIDTSNPTARGQCLQQNCIQPPCTAPIETSAISQDRRAPGNDATTLATSTTSVPRASKSCEDGKSRCEGKTIQHCQNNQWASEDYPCPERSYCTVLNDVAQCWVDPTDSPTPTPTPAPCTPGERRCDASAYALYLCGDDKIWKMEKKCTTPGDCITDGDGQAHCERGGIDPPRVKRRI